MTWGVFLEDDDKHIVPLQDRREHEVHMDCWCKPWRMPDDDLIVVHVAADFREAHESDATPRPS